MNKKVLGITAEQLHIWYLEATKAMNPEAFNQKAQKSYNELTGDQKFIDICIAQRINEKVVSVEWIEKIGFEMKEKELKVPFQSDYSRAWNDGFGTAIRRLVLAVKKEAGKK